MLKLQGSKRGRSSTPSSAIPPTPSKRASQVPLPAASASSTDPLPTPILPLLEPEDQEDDEEGGPPGLDSDSEDEDDTETLDFGSDAGGIHEDRDQAHDHYVEAWWTSIQSWCNRTNIDPKNFFNVVDATRNADHNLVAPVENAEVEFDDMLTMWMECYHADLGSAIGDGATLAARWDTDKKTWAFFIEREIHNLTKEEEKKFHKECVVAKEKEL